MKQTDVLYEERFFGKQKTVFYLLARHGHKNKKVVDII